MRLGRLVEVVGGGLAIVLVLGCGSASGVEVKRVVSPCGKATAPTWSPDGTHIAWYGFRWPLPANRHAVGSNNLLRAICISDADGSHLHSLAHTACSEHCPNAFSDPPGQLEWVTRKLLLSGNDLGIFAVASGRKPRLLGRTGPVRFSTDGKGDRVASGLFATGCSGCSGPVKILNVSSGAVVGLIGGAKVDNGQPSLSPDGTQVVFTRTPGKDSGQWPAIWTAAADGSHLRLLEQRGSNPLWSPAGNRIAYLAPAGGARSAWRLVSPQGGASTMLMRNGTGTVFGWSPDGRRIAFPDSNGRRAVIDVATRKVRTLLRLQLPYSASSVAWSPDSRQLLVDWRPPAHSSCPSGLWRVPLNGAKARLIHGC